MVDVPNRIAHLLGEGEKPPRWRHGDWMGVEIVRRWLWIQRVVMFAVLACGIATTYFAWRAAVFAQSAAESAAWRK